MAILDELAEVPVPNKLMLGWLMEHMSHIIKQVCHMCHEHGNGMLLLNAKMCKNLLDLSLQLTSKLGCSAVFQKVHCI